MKNILVPLGSSKSAANTLQYAIDMAQQMDANVYVISIFRELSRVGGLSKVNTLMKEESEHQLDAVLKAVDHKDVSVIAHPIKGGIVEGVERFAKHVPVDLMILSPRSNSVNDEVYLGKTTGSLVKGTNIPVMIVPDNLQFEGPEHLLMAFKDGRFPKKKVLHVLYKLKEHFNTEVHVLHVHTPNADAAFAKVSGKIKKLASTYKETENATTFQGVLEHFQSHNPDMLCVTRRKRGFFKKLWESDTVLKREFHTSKPLLILSTQE